MRALVAALAVAPIACAHDSHRSTIAAATALPAPPRAADRAAAPKPWKIAAPPQVAHATAPALPPAPAFSVASAASPAASAAAPSASRTPKIYSVVVQPSVVHTGDAVSWIVRTSHDVVSVSAHVSAYTLPLRQQGAGRFFLGFTIPSNVPPIFHGTYSLELTARTQSGATAVRTVPMIFQ